MPETLLPSARVWPPAEGETPQDGCFCRAETRLFSRPAPNQLLVENQGLESPLGVPRDPRLGLFRSRDGWPRGTVRETPIGRPSRPPELQTSGRASAPSPGLVPGPRGRSRCHPRDLSAAQMRRRGHREARARAEGRGVSWETRHQTASQPSTFREHAILASHACVGSVTLPASELRTYRNVRAVRLNPARGIRCGSLWQLRGACPGGWRPRVQGARAAVGTAEGSPTAESHGGPRGEECHLQRKANCGAGGWTRSGS